MLVDSKSVVLTDKEFEALPEYSCSLPTETTVGKLWKRRLPYAQETSLTIWVMGEYIDIGLQDEVGIKWREIIILSACCNEQPKEIEVDW